MPRDVAGTRPYVYIEEYGASTINNFFNLNLRAEKKFKLPGAWGDVGILFDVLNVTNEGRVRGIWTTYPFFGEPTSLQSAREWRLGLRWIF